MVRALSIGPAYVFSLCLNKHWLAAVAVAFNHSHFIHPG